MIFIKLASQKRADLTFDGEHIDWVGVPFSYDPADPGMRDELVRHNRGIWRVGGRAQDERYIAFVFKSKVLCLAEISSVEPYPDPEGKGRSYFVCRSLAPGDAAYDKWMGKGIPSTLRSRNPVSYWNDPELDDSRIWSWRRDGEALALIDRIAADAGSHERLVKMLNRIAE